MGRFTVRDAQRQQAKLRLMATSPSGGGKTFGSLLLAAGLGGKIVLIDTERGSSDKYDQRPDLPKFRVIPFDPPFTPEAYIEAIDAAEADGADVIIIDSTSHEWDGPGGCLELVDEIARAKFRGNTWSAWSELTPRHRKFIDRMLASRCHIIATARSKTETAQVDEGGRKKVVKLGMKSITRDGTEFEFDVVLDIVHDGHFAVASKDRTGVFSGDPKPITVETGRKLAEWLNGGAPAAPTPKPAVSVTPPPADRPLVSQIPDFSDRPLGDQIRDFIAVATNVRTLGKIGNRIDELASDGQLTAEEADELRQKIDKRHDQIDPVKETA
jgi:hypothetical protein